MNAHAQQFEDIYSRLYKTVYYFILHKIGDPDTADDLVQEVFMTAYKAWKEIPDFESCRNFLFIMARNRLIDHWRSAHSRYSFVPKDADEENSFFENIPSGEKLQEDWFKETERKSQAVQILNTLKESDREILLAKFVQDMSYKEISDVYSISEESARKRVERALKKARENI